MGTYPYELPHQHPTPETGVAAKARDGLRSVLQRAQEARQHTLVTMGASDDTAPDAATDVAANLRVISGNPTETELAAITAVLAGIAEELGSRLHRRPILHTTAWEAVQRPIRGRILPDITRWRGYSG